MDLIDRYLAAIARRLPADKADDIVAEIRDDLLTRIEVREDQLGRRLGQDEVAALIKEVGHPLVIASRFGPQRYLIGPDAFPFFVATLRIVLMIVGVIFAIETVSSVAFEHTHITRAAAHAFSGLLNSALLALGTVVAVFYGLERGGFPRDHLRKWNPKELPEVKDKQPGPWGSAFEVAVGLFFIAWWCGLIPGNLFVYSNVDGLTLTPDPIWAPLWWPVLALMVARLVHNLVQWLRPRWKVALAALSVATTAGALALLGVIYQAGHWLTASGTLPAERLAHIDRSTNLGLRYAIVVVGAVWVFQCLQELWRLYAGRR